MKSTLCLLMALVCNVAWAEVTLPTVSTGAEMHFYRIKSARTNKYAAYTGDNTQLAQTTETTSSTIWYVTATASNKYRLHNLSTDKKYASVSSFTADGSIVYIKENPYNAGYVCVSTTENLSSNCWDDQSNQTKIGNYNPRNGDAVGTSWTFEEVTVNEGLIAESYSIILTETILNDTYTGNFTCYGYGDVKLLPLGVSEMGASLTNVVWGENTLTADIKFPLPVSKEGNARPVVISGFKGSLEAGSSKYYVDGTNVKARPSGTVANRYDEWEIYPTFANGVFAFVIKNVGANKYIKSNATEAVELDGTITVVDKAEATSFALEQGNRFKLPGTSLYLSIGSSSGTKNLGLWGYYSNNGGVHYGVSNFVYLSQLPCVLTDADGNQYTGTLDGTTSTLPSFPGLTVSNKAFNEDGTNFTATVTFPFSVSKSGEENWTFIKSFPMNQRDCYFHVDDAYTKVITRSTIAANGMTYLPTVGNIAKWQWAIYPAFADGKFTFTIKNRAANKFVGGTSGTSTVNPTPLVAEDAAGVFCWGACIGSGNGFYLANNTNMFFAANSSSEGDQHTILWPKPQSGSNHQGANLRFPEASYTVTTDGNGYAAIYTPMAVTIPSGVTAYVGRLNADNSVLFLEAVSTAIPANTAVILKGAASTTYVLAKSSDAVATIDGNVLQGAETSVEVSAIEGSAYTYQASNTTFAKVTEGAIPAYSVYVASQGGADVISIDDTRAEAISHVVANASKLGQDFGRAYYVANGTKLYTADDARAAIYAAADADAANEIVGSFKYNIPATGTPYYLKNNHGTYLDLHHLGTEPNNNDYNQLATMSATMQLVYITGDETDGTWKIHTTAEGGNYLHQSTNGREWNSWVSDAGGDFKWEVEGVEIEGVPHYMLKHNSGTQNGYLGADNHTAGNALFVNQSDQAKKLKMQLLPVKSITTEFVPVAAEWLNEECVDVASENVPAGAKFPVEADHADYASYKSSVVTSGEYFYLKKGCLTGVFNWHTNSGNKRVNIVAVEVVDLNDAVVAADYHYGYAGNPSSNNTYTVDVPEDGLYYIRYYAEKKTNGGVNNSDVDITYTYMSNRKDLYNTSKGSLEVPPYRIPGITVDPETGRIITTAARLVCGTDPGYGQVDVVCRISDNHGDTWSEMKEVAVGTGITSPEENYFDTAFGDPAVVADRTSNEVLIIVVAGCTKYQTATRAIPNEIGTIHSLDNGNTWGTPVRVTEQIYSLFDAVNGGNPIESAFVGGGKIFQSRIVKVGQYYRLYAAMCARPDGNRVIYSDDFGRTWKALGGAAALPAPGGDEPKCEELPDGRVILSSRVGGGRIYNIYTYSNTETAEGTWGTSVTSTFEGSGKTHNGQSTNGEILIVPVVRNSDGKDMYLVLQSLPTGGGRTNVGIFYKELTDLTDINTVANFAIDWNGFYQVSYTTSAYSSMDLQNDNRIGFIYEENYTKHGVVSNPHSVPFPDANNLGTHNYDGYDNIYVAYPLEIITNGAYSIKPSVDRRKFLRSYFTDLTADVVDEVKAAVADDLATLSAEPTIAEVDGIYFNIGKGDVITAANANKGKVGYYLDAAVDTYKAEVIAATTRDELAAAEIKLTATNAWNMPVNGKAYTFKNVQKDGTTVRWYKYDTEQGKIVLTATEDEATPFVCRFLEENKYVFVCNDGKYMTWRASVPNYTDGTGVNDAYHGEGRFLTDITIAKMTSGGQIASGVDLSNTRYVSISAKRPDKNETGYVVIMKSKTNNAPDFDGAGAAFYNDNYSSAFIMEEAAYANTPKLNGVGKSELMSSDLHDKYMGTFSAPFPTVVPEGVTAYYGAEGADGATELVRIADDEAIPANQGVILIGEEEANAVMLPVTSETIAAIEKNALANSAGAAIANLNGYVLAAKDGVAGFYKAAAGSSLAMNKAYIASSQQAGANAPTMRIRLAGTQGGTTEIEGSELKAQGSQLIYDLQGRRVEQMVKGHLYIVNGKKVIF